MCKTTKHAERRIKQRCGIQLGSSTRFADLALERGLTHSQTTGSLKRFIDGLYLDKKLANNIRVYGDKVFLFRGTTLITVVQLPQKYLKTYAKLQAKYSEG